MQVEIVFALPRRQAVIQMDVEAGATVADVIRLSGLTEAFPQEDLAVLQAGIWGKPVARGHRVRAGDRVELYRPLEIDPKEARRLKVGG